jgi:hypothetical protein
MTDQRQTSGTRLAARRILGGAMAVGVTTVMLVAFSATSASARPAVINPPAVTGTVTTGSGGLVTVSVSGTWSWNVGTAAGDVNIPTGSPASQCGGHYGVGWGTAWNDPADPGYTLSYKNEPTLGVGSKLAVNGNKKDDEAVEYAASAPCGTFNAGDTAVVGQWTDHHTYASASAVPTQICVVTYLLRSAPGKYPRQYKVDKNKKNSLHAAAKAKPSAIAYATTPNCFSPGSLVASPVIVTTATNAQVGSPITDTSSLTGTSQDVTTVLTPRAITVASNAGGTVIFKLYGPSDTGCTSTPIFTSSPITVNGDGTYGPVSFTPTQGPGTYRWIAQYRGDPSNNGATELCGAAGETSTVSATAASTTPNAPTSPSSSVPVKTTAAVSDPGTGATTSAPVTAPTAVTGATTVHTGEAWAGSRPYLVVLIAFGLSLLGLGYLQRRRIAVRRDGSPTASSAD